MTAEGVRSAGFHLNSATVQHVPAVHIGREWCEDLKDDPYNEDGRPPTVFTTIVYPQFDFNSNGVEITGLEAPNMAWAGLVRPAYDMCRQLELPDERIWKTHNEDKPPFLLDDLKRQKVYLSIVPMQDPKDPEEQLIKAASALDADLRNKFTDPLKPWFAVGVKYVRGLTCEIEIIHVGKPPTDVTSWQHYRVTYKRYSKIPKPA